VRDLSTIQNVMNRLLDIYISPPWKGSTLYTHLFKVLLYRQLQHKVLEIPRLRFGMTRKFCDTEGEKSGDSQITFDIHYFLRIATFFPLDDPEKPCHPEAQRRISCLQQELFIKSFESENQYNNSNQNWS